MSVELSPPATRHTGHLSRGCSDLLTPVCLREGRWRLMGNKIPRARLSLRCCMTCSGKPATRHAAPPSQGTSTRRVCLFMNRLCSPECCSPGTAHTGRQEVFDESVIASVLLGKVWFLQQHPDCKQYLPKGWFLIHHHSTNTYRVYRQAQRFICKQEKPCVSALE